MMLGPLSRKKFPGWLAYQEWQIRRSILMISALTMVLQGAGILMDSQAVSSEIFDNLLVWRASHIVYGFLVGAITACAGRRLSYPRLTAVAIITLAPVFPFVWYAQAVYLGHQTHFGIIPGFKLPPLVVAALDWGNAWVGLTFVIAFTLQSIAFWIRHEVSKGPLLFNEPLVTIMFTVASLMICYLRFLATRSAKKLFDLQARLAALRQMARLLLWLRDRANTPLQKLEIGVSVILNGKEAATPAVASLMKSAVDQLKLLLNSFNQLDSFLDFNDADPLQNDRFAKWFEQT